MPEANDEALLLAAGRGDRDAFGVLVERHHRAVVQFVYRFLGDATRDTAEDLAQDVFVRAWKSAPSFRPRAKVLTWLLRLATNVCLNHRRSRRYRRTTSLGLDEASGSSGPADADAIAREQTARLRSAVAGLPSGQRSAIVLRHFHDLSYADIAEVLETSVPAVESLLFRARKTLNKTLTAPIRAGSPQVSLELSAESP